MSCPPLLWKKKAKLPGVYFNNPLAQSANAPANGVWHKRCNSVPPTKLCPSLPAHTTGSLAQLLRSMVYAMHQKYQRKSSDAKAAIKMMTKLTTGVDFINVLMYCS